MSSFDTVSKLFYTKVIVDAHSLIALIIQKNCIDVMNYSFSCVTLRIVCLVYITIETLQLHSTYYPGIKENTCMNKIVKNNPTSFKYICYIFYFH